MQAIDRLLHGLNGAAQICAFQPRRHSHITLQVLSPNFVLAGQFLYRCERIQSRSMTCTAVEKRVASMATSSGVKPARDAIIGST